MSNEVRDIENAINTVVATVEKAPLAIKATRLFLERVIKGDNIADAMLKTAEIIALEESL